MENADEVFMLCDSSKLEKDSYIRFAPLSSIDYLITDVEVDQPIMNKYLKQGINIINEPY